MSLGCSPEPDQTLARIAADRRRAGGIRHERPHVREGRAGGARAAVRQHGPCRAGESAIAMIGAGRESYKRPFDLCVVGAAALALLPVWAVLCVTIPLAIRLESRGPVLYRQVRLGRGGRAFTLWKFRTMVNGAERETGPVWATRRDPRVTRVGRLLRRWHLDELPQVVNVVRGEMSLVGPRPERPTLAARAERAAPGFSRRLAVRPGIAGLAQAQGAGHRDPRAKLRYDLQYISRMGPWLDLVLCARCVRRVLGRRLRAFWTRRGRASPRAA